MTPAPDEKVRPSFLRRLYDRVLAEAETKRGPAVLAAVAFTESSFFPIPPDPLLIALGIGSPRKAIPLAILTTISSVLGGLLGYAIGVSAMETIGISIITFFHAEQTFDEVVKNFQNVGFIAVLAAALTPLPYKVFTIASGVAGLPLGIFLGASLLGRGMRFLAEGLLIRIWGKSIAGFIERWFGGLTLLALVLGVLGFLVLGLGWN
ncbi:MAG: VTT domain-containing protein [Planctomycetota bacterium]